MGLVQKDAFRTMIISYLGIILGYLNKGVLFLLILTTEEIGLLNLMVSVGLLFAQFANMGTVFTTWKFLPFFKNPDRKHHGFLPLMLLIVLVGTLVCLALAFIFREPIEQAYLEKSPEFVDYFYWVFPIGIGYVFFMVLETYLRGFYKNIVSVVAFEIVLRLFVTLSLIAFWWEWIDFAMLVYTNSLIYLIPTIILVFYLQASGELYLGLSTIQISKRFKRIILLFSSYNYINTLGVVLVRSMDVIMVAQIIGLKATGVYSTIVFLSSAIQVPYRSIVRISSPIVAEYWKHRRIDEMKELYVKVSSISLLICWACFIYIWLNIDFLFSFLNEDFQSGIWVFFFLMIGKMVDMYCGLNGAIFSTSKKYKYDIYFTLLLIGLVYGLNLLLIPIWGISGAAISTSIALIAYNIGRLLFVWVIYKIHPFERNQFIIIGLGLLTLFAGVGLDKLIDNGWWQLLAESVLFFVLFLLPIYVFNLEKESVGFLKNGTSFLTSKLKQKK